MRRKIFSGILTAILNVAVTAQAAGIVYLHIGYIDEEINVAIKHLVNRHSDTPIVILADGEERSSALFQKPLRFYSHRHPIYGQDNHNLKSLNMLQSYYSSKSFNSTRKEIYQKYSLDGVQTESNPSRAFRLLAFNEGAARSGQDIILALKCIEFGRQPGLIGPLLRNVIDAVHNLPEARNGVLVSSFGTSGAVRTETLPGTAFSVRGSVFLGLQVEHHNDRRTYRAVVRMFDPELGRSIDYYKSKTFDNKNLAESDLAALVSDSKRLLTLQSPETGAQLGARTRHFTQSGVGFSLTLSYFGASTEKSVARELGISNINMEDFHVLEAASLTASGVKLDRVTTDPAKIDAETIDRLYRWSKNKKYSVADYVEGIMWGLEGTPLQRVPAQAKWDLYPAGTWPKNQFFVSRDVGIPLDPFFLEMSLKFLPDAAELRLFGIDSISKSIVDVLSPKAVQELKLAVERHAKDVGKSAQEIMAAATEDPKRADLRSKIKSLVTLSAELPIPSNSTLYKEMTEVKALNQTFHQQLVRKHSRIPILSRSEAADTGEQVLLDVWVRASKWRNKTNKLNYVSPDQRELSSSSSSLDAISLTRLSEMNASNSRNFSAEFAASLADRALYRAAMTPVTEEVGPKVLENFGQQKTYMTLPARHCSQLSRQQSVPRQ